VTGSGASGPRGFDARRWLDAHVNLETGVGAPPARPRGAPTLERIALLLQYLGSPETEFRSIHVTGTNGKTSTARILVQLLQALGLRVGAFTSPHLERLNERVTIDGVPIDDEALDEALYAVSLVERSVGVDPSHFEIMAAAAFRWFADEAVDVAVVEVGLGGTWDATNVIDAEVAVITNVSLDHVEYLGPTRADIARDKAGIVKPGATLVLGEADPALRPAFEATDAARVLVRGTDFGVSRNELAVGGRLIDCYSPGAGYPETFLALHGAHQGDNASIALAAAEAFVGAPLPAEVVSEAFATVTSPGRLEIVGRDPLILLDGAHNVAGIATLRRALDEEFGGSGPDAHPCTYVVGLLREKDPAEMLAALGIDAGAGERGDALVCCRAPSPRALDPGAIAHAAQRLGFPAERIEVADAVADAIAAALLVTAPDGRIVVTGSLYAVGAARTVCA